MKKVYFIICFLFVSRLVSAQTTYSHDSSGNRIKRLYSSPPLPVTLISFIATKEGTTASLDWQTSSETNSDRFEVERSQDGKKWIFLGSVAAMGDKASRYVFVDKVPMDGENLYRLKMIDKDETFAYSRIQSLKFVSQITFYPNPVKDHLKIKGVSSGEIQVFNSAGKMIYNNNNNKIRIESIDMSSFPTGIFLVKILSTDGSLITKKVLKQ
ncbi:MAG: T9SS type A sorting domain-containing protein [Dyadobacter sp.]